MAWQGRQIVIEHHRKMWVGVIPLVYKGRALALWFASCFFLLGMTRFGMGRLFSSFTLGGWLINNVFFPLGQEKPLLFTGNMEKGLGDVYGGMREETTRRMRERRRSCKRENVLWEIKSKDWDKYKHLERKWQNSHQKRQWFKWNRDATSK